MNEGEREPLPPERPTFKPLLALESRMLLVASDPTKIDVINPENKSVPGFAKQDLTDFNKHDYSLFNGASTNERRQQAGVKREELDAEVTKWAESCLELIKSDPRSKNLKRFFHKDLEELQIGDMRDFYNRYFIGENRESDIKRFVLNIIDNYLIRGKAGGRFETDALREDMDSIVWFSHVFGSNSAEIVTQLIDAEAQLMNAPDEFVQQGNQNVNNFTEDSDDERLLKFLWSNRPSAQPQQQEPRKFTPTDQEPIPAGEHTLNELFTKVVGPVQKDHDYFVENPPESIQLNEQQMESLNLVEPFFVRVKSEVDGRDKNVPNPKVVPFVYELGATSEDGIQNLEPNRRFINGERATYGDSALFALAATSAETPEKQAQLYRVMVDAILKIHLARFTDSGRGTLFNHWYGAQQAQNRWQDPQIIDSLRIFEFYDKVPDPNDPKKRMLRPENERLLMYDENGKITSMDRGFWYQRALDLTDTLASGKLATHHLRWIECLSHSVNVAKLVEIIKSQQPVTPEPITPPEPPKPPPAQINNVEGLINLVENQPLDKPLTFSVTQEGLSKLLPDVLIQGITAHPAARLFNPQVDLTATHFIIDPADQGTLIGTIIIKGNNNINIALDIEFKNSPDGEDIVPSSVKVDPPSISIFDLQKMIDNYVNVNLISEALRRYLQKTLEKGGKSKRQLKKVRLHINPKDQTLDGEIA